MSDSYLGLVSLSTALRASFVTRDGSNTPKDATIAPGFRIYGPSGVMNNGTGTLSFKDPSSSGGAITGATNASPIVITSANHKLSTGTRVTIAGVGGNTAANGDFQVTAIDANTFSLNGSTGNGAYTSGGTWHTTGLYDINYTPTGTNGFAAGQNYSMLVTFVVSGVTKADILTFTVV
jgi:hypothetical protein